MRPPEHDAAPRALGPAGAALAGWIALAIVNAVLIPAALGAPPSGPRARFFHHAYDAGHHLALGMIASAATGAWRVAAAQLALRRAWSYVALAIAATAVGAIVLEGDLTGLAGRLLGERLALVGIAAITAGAGAIVAVLAWLGQLLARPRARVAGVSLGLACGVANSFVLANDYPGVHFFIAWSAATLIAASLAGAALPFDPAGRVRLARVPLAIVAATSLVVTPRNAVQVGLLQLPGSVAAPLLARLRMADPAPSPAEIAAVWPGPSPRPDVPASAPRLVTGDAIVLFIVIDAVRADVVMTGKHAALLPEIDRIRRESVAFTRARSPASGTIWALSSIFSGRYYSELHWTPKIGAASAKPYPHDDANVRFPQLLAASAIRTVAISQMPDVANDYGTIRGFSAVKRLAALTTAPAWVLMGELVDTLSHPRGGAAEGPLFVYVHFLDPHYPYDRATHVGTPYERYVREIALVDRQLGRLRREIDRAGLGKRVSMIVTSDHGEAFGEHGTEHHAVSVYDELLRVPLLIQVPGVPPRTVDRDVTLMDIGPTVLDLMGVATPGGHLGASLVPYLRGEDPSLDRPIAADTGRFQQALVFPDGLKLIRDRRRGTLELFDLRTDPGENDDLFDHASFDAAPYERRARAFFHVHRLRRPGYEVPFRP